MTMKSQRGLSIPEIYKQTSSHVVGTSKDEGATTNRLGATSSRPGVAVPRPATQLVSDLYNDYFTRNKKKEQMQNDTHLNRQKIINQKSRKNI